MGEINIVKGSIWHVLNFLTMTVIEYGLTLAMERELADLKGLVRPDAISESEDRDAGICTLDIELELLGLLDDPAIKIILETIKKLLDCAKTYRIVIGLDVEELVAEDRYNDMAGDTWHSMYYEIFGNTYEEILGDIPCLYDALGFMIYICVCQLKHQQWDVFDFVEEEYGKCMMEVFKGAVSVENNRAQLLIDLITDIQMDSMRIYEL
jgi:hypothetical protein